MNSFSKLFTTIVLLTIGTLSTDCSDNGCGSCLKEMECIESSRGCVWDVDNSKCIRRMYDSSWRYEYETHQQESDIEKNNDERLVDRLNNDNYQQPKTTDKYEEIKPPKIEKEWKSVDEYDDEHDDIDQINQLISQYFETWQCILVKDSSDKLSELCGENGEEFWYNWWFENAVEDLQFDEFTNLDDFLAEDNGYRKNLIEWNIINRYKSLIFVPGLADIKFNDDMTEATAIFGASSMREDPANWPNAEKKHIYAMREFGFRKVWLNEDNYDPQDVEDEYKWKFTYYVTIGDPIVQVWPIEVVE